MWLEGLASHSAYSSLEGPGLVCACLTTAGESQSLWHLCLKCDSLGLVRFFLLVSLSQIWFIKRFPS